MRIRQRLKLGRVDQSQRRNVRLGPQGRAREGREGASGSGLGCGPLLPYQETASGPTLDPAGEPLPGRGGWGEGWGWEEGGWGGRAFPTAAGWLPRSRVE